MNTTDEKFPLTSPFDAAAQNRVGRSAVDELLTKAFHLNPSPMTVSTLAGGRYLDANEAFFELTGYSREDVFAADAMTLDIYENPEDRAALIGGLQAHKRVRNREIRFRMKSGEVRVGLLSAELIELEDMPCILTTVDDITERQRAEAALREKDVQLQLVTNSVPVLISYVDRDERYRFNNRAYEEWFGHSQAELAGKSVKEVLGDAAYEKVRPLIDAALRRGERVAFAAELPYKDGGTRHISAAYIPDIAEDGSIRGYIALVSDITERQRLEEELRRRAEELTEANRIKDEFLATLSHELRTPLISILGWSSMLASGKLDPETVTTGLASIRRNAQAQARLVDELLDVARIITGKMRVELRPLNLAPLLETVVDAVRPTADVKRITINLDCTQAPVFGDAARLQQVVWNLLSNAIKFTPPDGAVAVRLECADQDAVLTVKDTGEGIAPEFLPVVFDRFRQADSSNTRVHGGLGLGLASVRHFVEMHGGSVEAASAGRGQGATFTVTLPLLPLRNADFGMRNEEATAEQFAIRNPHSAILEGLRLLVVDDDDDLRDLLTGALSNYGAQVAAAASAGAALSALAEAKFDMLIADIGMPQENGYALIAKVRALPPERGGDIPAIALTAYAHAEDRARALAAGYQLHISKPVDPIELAAAVAHLAAQNA